MEVVSHRGYVYYPMCVIERVNKVNDNKKLVKQNQLLNQRNERLIKENEKTRKENEQLKSKIRVMEGYLKFIGGKNSEHK